MILNNKNNNNQGVFLELLVVANNIGTVSSYTFPYISLKYCEYFAAYLLS